MKRYFKVWLFIRILLVCIFFVGALILFYERHYPATAVIVMLFTLIQIIALVHMYDKSNRDLKRFLMAVEYADFSQSFESIGLGKSYEELSSAFTRVMKKFQGLRMEKQEQFHYLQTVVRHVETGLIAFNSKKEIFLFNNAAKKILDVQTVRHLNDLKPVSENLLQRIEELDSKEPSMVKIIRDDELRQLSVHAAFLRQKGEPVTLISIQDIQSELEEKEMESWQKLIRVLTHEIMNSITPITSMADTAQGLLQSISPEEEKCLSDEFEDVKDALETIHSRSVGLMHFVNSYRNLTRIPRPEFSSVSVKNLLKKVIQLYQDRFYQEKIQFLLDLKHEGLHITADKGLIEQVLINIILNAIHALEHTSDKRLVISVDLDPRGRVLIHISDNGPGIEPDAMEKVFIPFYTTKKSGSGIGLSLSRQIMRYHKGALLVRNNKQSGATFTLRF